MSNPVLFVSLGPGDPELVTLKTLRALQESDVVFCPATKGGSRSMFILSALEVAPDKIRAFAVPMSEERSEAKEAYRRVARDAAEAHHAGRRVVITAEGDAGFYATTDYISEELAAEGIPSSRIAGVPAFLACGALADITVARQNEGMEIVPGTLSPEMAATMLAKGKTVVVMKASRCEAAIKRAVGEILGAEFHYFENAGVAGKEFHTSDHEVILARKFPYFSLVIIRPATAPAARRLQ